VKFFFHVDTADVVTVLENMGNAVKDVATRDVSRQFSAAADPVLYEPPFGQKIFYLYITSTLEYCNPTLPYPTGRVPARVGQGSGTILKIRVGAGGFEISAGRGGRV
jgi:hypothetical protein